MQATIAAAAIINPTKEKNANPIVSITFSHTDYRMRQIDET